MNQILLNIESKEKRYAVLKNGILKELVVERNRGRQITGNIYRGRVENILEGIQSAFIEINEEDNGFIHISDILENTKKFEELFDLDFDVPSTSAKRPTEEVGIGKILKPGQPVLVQVIKEPMGSKGPRLTANVSIAGRYLVLLPNSSHRGVSRKIEDRDAREKLKQLIRSFEMPQDMGLICRTASVNATRDMLIDEAHELLASWQIIVEKFQKSSRPTLLYTESDLIKRAVLSGIDKKYDRMIVDDQDTYQICKKIAERHSSEHVLKVEYYRDPLPMFEKFQVEKEIEKGLKRKVWLPSGGYLFFDRTEAMYTIDVNSGRSSSNKGDVEESLVQINLEAAEEIARQLRLRNIGGLIVCDFIDMRSQKNQRRVLERLKDCMKDDPAKCTILKINAFGLLEMTRERSRGSLMQTLLTGCPYCNCNGMIKSHETVAIEIERSLKKAIRYCKEPDLLLVVHPELRRHLVSSREDRHLQEIAASLEGNLAIEEKDSLHLNDFHFYAARSKKKIEGV